MLQVDNLTRYKGNLFRNLSLTVHAGEIAVLFGSSGVGKSTLLRILNGLASYDEGKILFEEKIVTSQQCSDIFGMVFQEFHLFPHLTVLENILLPLRTQAGFSEKELRQQGEALLKVLGVQDKAGQKAVSLSGGQKQRVAIARVLARKPKIICMDEPTSALDPRHRNDVFQQMQQLAEEGYGLLVTSHDTSIIEKLSCTIHLLQEGVIIESASSQSYRAHRARYPALHAFLT